jgi:hypothetical protein
MTPDQLDSSGELAELLKRLADEIEILRETVDELRDELTYELRKLRDVVSEPTRPFRLASLPRNPCAVDFHAQVNAVDRVPVSDVPPSPAELLDRLMREPATVQLTADDWDQGHEFAPDEVVEIEGSIFDWFAENLEAVHQGPEHFVADDGQGGWFLLWCRDGRCCMRLLTAAHQAELNELAEPLSASPSRPGVESGDPRPDATPPLPRSEQQTLW